jgi:NAD(P)-dependent dehydrogenase (short-subunit alcohol dehydrogenase family)
MHSKMALAVMMNNLASRWENIRIVNVDPGPNKTKMTSGSGMPGWLVPFRNLIFSSPEKGAMKLYEAAFNQKFKEKSGVYISGNKLRAMKYALEDSGLEAILEAGKPQ